MFCDIAAGTIPSRPVATTETTYAFMDIHPASDGHLLVVPRRHSTDLRDIEPQDLTDVTLEAQRIARAMFDAWDVDGVNLLNCCGEDAWQSVFHFHLHVIPRYRDKGKDRLVLPFEPNVPGDPDVMNDLSRSLSDALKSA
ncbi:HIT family protein [Spelaeicoccus albus]